MEEEVVIQGPGGRLEGRFLPGTTPGGAVITHPHPLYGGSMDNNVVWAAARAFGARQWSTLRFNFRGVGQSTGSYGEGLAEVEDVAAALKYLTTRTSRPHYAVGYSFGAFVVAQAMRRGLAIDGAILIAPPIAFMDVGDLAGVPRLKLIVVGDQDELCPLPDLEALLSENPTSPTEPPPVALRIIQGADHFFGGWEKMLFQVMRDFPLARAA